jgi:16S rRNA processing protein RimM
MQKLPNNSSEQLVVVGQLGRPQGIQGGMRLNSYTSPVDNILDYQPWFIQKKESSAQEELKYTKVEKHAKGLVIFLENISDRNTAILYTQANIAIPRTQLPKLSEDEHYWSDLEGLNVENSEGISLGQIDHLFETGSNDVLVIKGEKTHLIPYLKGNTVLKIDLPNKIMVVDWDPNF